MKNNIFIKIMKKIKNHFSFENSKENSKKKKNYFKLLLAFALGFFSMIMFGFYNGCTQSSDEPSTKPPRAEMGEVIERTKGINIGESLSIWAVNFISPGVDNTLFNIYSVALNVEKDFPIKTWKLKTPDYMSSPSGSRTYVSEWGLLIARSATVGSAGPSNEVTLYLVANDSSFELVKNQVSGIRAIFTTGGPANSAEYDPLYRDNSPEIKGIKRDTKEKWNGRASALSYKITANGRDYKYIGVIWRLEQKDPTVRLERFLWDETAKTFIRVRPYEFTPQENNVAMEGVGVYTGALSPCDPHLKKNGQCIPAYYGAPFGKVFGVKLDADVPSTKYDNNQKGPIYNANANRYLPPNVNPRFQSSSHPSAGAGQFGSINGGVYSAAVDTSTDDTDEGAGSLYISNQSSLAVEGCCSTHVAFESVNNLVFTAFRESVISQPPAARSQTGRSIISVFKKDCFYKTADCGPDPDDSTGARKNKFRVFADVGASLGPISDLGTGCVASLDLNRPSEGGKTFSGVYRICAQDPNDLDKGVGSLKIADLEGNSYMYNDFTAATLYDRPIILTYDFFTEGQLESINNVKFYWEPKQGYSTSIFGLKLSYRCYEKGSQVTETSPAFNPIVSTELPPAYNYSKPFQKCEGSNINQVDLKIERIERQKYTRFQKIKVSSDR